MRHQLLLRLEAVHTNTCRSAWRQRGGPTIKPNGNRRRGRRRRPRQWVSDRDAPAWRCPRIEAATRFPRARFRPLKQARVCVTAGGVRSERGSRVRECGRRPLPYPDTGFCHLFSRGPLALAGPRAAVARGALSTGPVASQADHGRVTAGRAPHPAPGRRQPADRRPMWPPNQR